MKEVENGHGNVYYYFLMVNVVYYSIGKIVTTSLYHERLFFVVMK
jgi:hypothetical protein